MAYHSTNPLGRTHFKGDLVAGAGNNINGAKIGVVSTGGSTVVLEAVGDGDTAIALAVVPKGSGALRLGSTATAVQIGNSTTALGGVKLHTVQFTEPDMSSGPGHVDSTYTVSGATTNAAYSFSPRAALSTGYGIGVVRCSTADEVTITWTGNSASSLSGSSNRGLLLEVDA